jgi:hypothetical protein
VLSSTTSALWLRLDYYSYQPRQKKKKLRIWVACIRGHSNTELPDRDGRDTPGTFQWHGEFPSLPDTMRERNGHTLLAREGMLRAHERFSMVLAGGADISSNLHRAFLRFLCHGILSRATNGQVVRNHHMADTYFEAE